MTTEWKILYDLAKDKDSLLPKDVLRGLYNESLFHHLVWERKGSGQVRFEQHQLYSTSNFDRDKDREQNLK
jgi:hypothetical protein